MSAEDFQEYANHSTTGFMKPWKAKGMIGQYNLMMKDLPDEQVLSWVENCLLMEGFTHTNCVAITKWMRKNL